MILKQDAVKSLRPGVDWAMIDDDVKNIIWHTPGVQPLTEAEVADEMARLQTVAEAEAQAKIDAKASAVAKLQALGLTVEEVQVAFGLEA